MMDAAALLLAEADARAARAKPRLVAVRRPGRPPKLDAAALRKAARLLADGMTTTAVAAELGVARRTLYHALARQRQRQRQES
jgi:hypothetical protein